MNAPLLSKENDELEAAHDAALRQAVVSTKLSQSELDRLDLYALERKIPRSEAVRDMILAALTSQRQPSRELVELAGLRLMLNNFLKPLAQGKLQTREEIEGVVRVIRERKVRLAQEIMDGVKE